MYFHDCNIEKMIPIFLIVSAVAPMLFGGFGKRNEDDSFGLGAVCGIIGFLFSLAWLIAGTIAVKTTLLHLFPISPNVRLLLKGITSQLHNKKFSVTVCT